MSSSAIIALLMLGILATSIIPTDARQRTLRKKYSRSPSRREDAFFPDDESDSKIHLLPRIPITKSLSRKLSDMLSVAVAEAVAQVVDDEPGRITACDALLRRRSNNANHNYNVNKNVNKNTLKRQKVEVDLDDYLTARMGAETDEEDNRSAGASESEEAITDGDEVIEGEAVDPPPQQRRRSNPNAMRRRPQRQSNINSNYNDNKNIVYSRRTDQVSSKNATDASSAEDQLS